MLHAIALILVGIWLILFSQEVPSEALDLAFGIAIVVIAFLASPFGAEVRRRG